jgi:hypothetical protein
VMCALRMGYGMEVSMMVVLLKFKPVLSLKLLLFLLNFLILFFHVLTKTLIYCAVHRFELWSSNDNDRFELCIFVLLSTVLYIVNLVCVNVMLYCCVD